MLKAITLCGSIRRESHNSILARAMGQKLTKLGNEVNNIDLINFPLSMFNADFERSEGEPKAAVELAHLFAKADIVFIASPEYNGSLSPLLKNTLDWISRQRIGPYHRAVFGVGAASPGKMGGIGGLGHLREILGKMGALVAPTSLGVSFSADAFDSEGNLTDMQTNKRADELIAQLTGISRT